MSDCESRAIRRHIWSAAATMLVALFVQTAAAAYWAGQIAARVESAERDLVRVEQTAGRLETRLHTLEVR